MNHTASLTCMCVSSVLILQKQMFALNPGPTITFFELVWVLDALLRSERSTTPTCEEHADMSLHFQRPRQNKRSTMKLTVSLNAVLESGSHGLYRGPLRIYKSAAVISTQAFTQNRLNYKPAN